MKNLYLLFVLSFFYSPTFSQRTTNSAGFSGTGANMDVVYQRLNWTIDPRAAKNISGSVTTYFKTLAVNVSSLSFDLRSSAFNNVSLIIKYHGTACAKSFTGDVLNITLPSTITAINTLDSVTINYSGAPPPVAGAAQGYQVATDAAGVNYVNTLAESFEDRDWWPCKADMQDKIDAMDIIVTVPWNTATNDTFWVAANGKLVDSAISGNSRTFVFKTQYPIASYLVAVSVARFSRFYRVVNIGGTNVQVVYNILAGKSPTAAVNAMDQINLALVAFSNKFGDYPFKNDKHGFYDGLLGANGMEHQTFSSIAPNALSDLKTLTHELMHQWFGDNVSFATWNDLWLAEGFARYSEALVGELVPSLGINKYTSLSTYKSTALGLNTTSTYIPDANIATSDLIWNSSYGTTVYERGCMVVSMLRALCGDAIFFNTLTNYQTTLAGKSATTDTLNNYFNRALGVNIKPFFDDFVKGTGNPVYNIQWQAYGTGNKRLAVSVNTQAKNPAASPVSYFHTPIVLHVKGSIAAQDTTLVFYDMGSGNLAKAGNGIGATVAGNLLSYNLSFAPLTVAYDDSARTLSTGTTTKVSTLDLKVIDFTVKQNSTYNAALLTLDANSINSIVTLERSADAISFTIIGDMQLQQSAGTSLKYSINDLDPIKGTNYYRAKYKNLDGQYTYTNIVKIAANYKSKFSIINNPAKNILEIKNSLAALNHEYSFSIYDASGKLVSNTKNTITGNITVLKTAGLVSGIYILKIVSSEDDAETLKFIITQ